MPAARFASTTASTSGNPAPSIVATVAITVSPAPDTSYTSRASALTCSSPSCEKSVIPSSERVSSSASNASASRSFVTRARRSSSDVHRPTTSRSSARFGVISDAPR